MLPLELLQTGEWAQVAEVFGDADCVARLAELGFRPGAHIQMLQPGSPCLIRLEGTRLGLRPECAQHILVVPAAAPAVPCPTAGSAATEAA